MMLAFGDLESAFSWEREGGWRDSSFLYHERLRGVFFILLSKRTRERKYRRVISHRHLQETKFVQVILGCI